jgi:hypothetical protein
MKWHKITSCLNGGNNRRSHVYVINSDQHLDSNCHLLTSLSQIMVWFKGTLKSQVISKFSDLWPIYWLKTYKYVIQTYDMINWCIIRSRSLTFPALYIDLQWKHPSCAFNGFMHFIHIWYLGWPWSEHVHIIPISRKVDFCESYCPFHVRMVKQTRKGLQLLQKSTIREIGNIWACSDHGQPRYQIWIKCDKRQMTSCVQFGILIGHDLSMHILYRFHIWLIFARVTALFMFPYELLL